MTAGAGAARGLRRSATGGAARVSLRSYVSGMFWPLIGGFIAFLLLLVFVGWVTDTTRRSDGEGH